MDRLRELTQQGKAGVGREELAGYMKEASEGIDFLNEPRHSVQERAGLSIFHCDIKPHNLLLVGGGVKVADFGLARIVESSIADNTGGMTVAYAPPEFFQGQATRYSDQYSLAVSYVQLRTNRLPFEGTHYQIIAAHLTQPPHLEMLPVNERPVVARALAKRPHERWPSCSAFAEALEAAKRTDPPSFPDLRPGDPFDGSPQPRFLPSVDQEASVNVIRARLLDPAPQVRTAILQRIGGHRLGEMLDDVVPVMLQDDSEEVRGWAAWAVDRLQNPKAIPALIAAIHDHSWDVRSKAGWALVHLGQEAVSPVREVLKKSENPDAKEMARLVLERIS